MAINDVSLTSGMRANLLSLQGTVDLLNRTQNRLSTGKKVNSAIDNPVSYFASQALTSRASIINGLKDAMGQAVSTINSADKGITAITSMIEQAKGLAQSAQSAAAGATTTLDGTAASTYGTATINLASMSSHVTGSVSFQLTSGLASGNTVGIGGSTFTYTTAAGATNFTNATSLAAAMNTALSASGYTISESGGTITVAKNGIVTGDVTGTTGVVTAATQVTTFVTGSTVKFGSTTLTAGLDFTSTTTLVTALSNAGYTGSSATGNVVTVAQSTATVLASSFSAGTLTAATGTNEVRSFTVTDGANVAHTFTYTAGTDYIAGSTTAGTTVAGLLNTAVGDAGLGQVSTTGSTVTVIGASSELTSLQSQYNTLMTQMNAVAGDSGYKGKNLLNGDTLNVKFEGISLAVTGFTAKSTGDLAITASNTGATMWTKGTTNIDASLTQLDNALTTLRSKSSEMSGNLSIITARQTFSTSMINTLTEGSDKLTLADANEEGANMLMLQTRQSLSTTALSLSAQAAQSVLKLFG